MKQKSIVIIGGHHNSALVIARILRSKGFKVFWFGHKHTMKNEPSVSLEYQQVCRDHFSFIEIKTGKFYGTRNPLEWLKIIPGFVQSLYYLAKIKPKLIISFGGYLSFPVVLAGFLYRIKIIIHEQTAKAGLANRILAPLASKVLLTWQSSQKFFPAKKKVLVGLPLNQEIFSLRKKTSPFPEKIPTILVTGGKQGSHVINKAIEESLSLFLKKFNLIHQTGGIIKTGDYSRLAQKKRKLPAVLRSRYLIKKFFSNEEMIKMIKLSNLVISRSGAHITLELLALGKRAILIPYPWAYNNEQQANAKILALKGLASILPQHKLTGEALYQKAEKIVSNLKKSKKRVVKFKALVKKDAAAKIIEIIEKIIAQ